MADYPYTISTDFSNGVVSSKFHDEIVVDPTISPKVPSNIKKSADVCTVSFAGSLSSPEETALDAVVAAHDGVDPGLPIEINRKISGGSVTIPTNAIKLFSVVVDVESGASDDLDAILGGDVGTVVILRCTSNARPITVRDDKPVGSDKIECNQNLDFTMNQVKDNMMLRRRNANAWDEVSRSSN